MAALWLITAMMLAIPLTLFNVSRWAGTTHVPGHRNNIGHTLHPFQCLVGGGQESIHVTGHRIMFVTLLNLSSVSWGKWRRGTPLANHRNNVRHTPNPLQSLVGSGKAYLWMITERVFVRRQTFPTTRGERKERYPCDFSHKKYLSHTSPFRTSLGKGGARRYPVNCHKNNVRTPLTL